MDSVTLRSLMVQKKVDYRAAMNALGIGETAWYQKINGNSEFKLSEIQKLRVLLDLSLEQVDQIFFSPEVSKRKQADRKE